MNKDKPEKITLQFDPEDMRNLLDELGEHFPLESGEQLIIQAIFSRLNIDPEYYFTEYPDVFDSSHRTILNTIYED